MRKALVVGINHYERERVLHGCVNDAIAVKTVLERHGDGSPNFDVLLLTASGPETKLERRVVKQRIAELFADDAEIALFYFAGHGHIEATGGYLLTSECVDGDDGVSMDEVLTIANKSRAKNKIIILDCCHSGAAGSPAATDYKASLSEGVTILTASTEDQYALESNGSGVFTSLLVDALSGSAANLVGHVTPGSVYAHIDQSLGGWDQQRPIFKTNVKRFISLRGVQPSIALDDLRQITKIFPTPSHAVALDPSFEPTSEAANEENSEVFAILQKFNRVNLVKPVDEEHMYFAAMNSTACRLTVLGAHYWRLVHKKRI